MPSYLNHLFDPVNPPATFRFCYPRFVGDAGDVGRTWGDVENDAGDVDGFLQNHPKPWRNSCLLKRTTVEKNGESTPRVTETSGARTRISAQDIFPKIGLPNGKNFTTERKDREKRHRSSCGSISATLWAPSRNSSTKSRGHKRVTCVVMLHTYFALEVRIQ